MRIVHAVRSDAFAGVESHVARLARAQLARGDQVIVIGGHQERMRAAIGHGVRTIDATTVTGVLRAVHQVARGADVVHAHMTAAEIACATGLLGGHTPLVVTRHFARTRGSNPVSALVGAAAATQVSRQLAISRWVADSIAGDSVVVHPGVDIFAGTPVAGDRENVVLLAQRLEPEKETDLAIRAFAASGLAGAGWRLDVAGDGGERERLEKLVGELGLSAATLFLGHRDDVVALMSRSAVLLAPCRVEGLGLTVLEAMATALPVVAVAAGGHLETAGIVSGAALHPPGDVDAAAGLLVGLANDPARRDAYGAALQEIQRAGFTPEHQAAQTALVYEAVV
ncbi:glycosyltransferase family 4 protein [Intrasporangium mesophilum]